MCSPPVKLKKELICTERFEKATVSVPLVNFTLFTPALQLIALKLPHSTMAINQQEAVKLLQCQFLRG